MKFVDRPNEQTKTAQWILRSRRDGKNQSSISFPQEVAKSSLSAERAGSEVKFQCRGSEVGSQVSVERRGDWAVRVFARFMFCLFRPSAAASLIRPMVWSSSVFVNFFFLALVINTQKRMLYPVCAQIRRATRRATLLLRTSRHSGKQDGCLGCRPAHPDTDPGGQHGGNVSHHFAPQRAEVCFIACAFFLWADLF